MEIRTLKYFLAVAREENITRAAKFLHITQPTLSRQLMQLEEELDAQLFIRGKNRIVLTDEGMLLRRRAEEIVDLAKKTEKEPYCLDFALRDTAGEIRRLRNRRIAVLGVFAGEEEDLSAEKKIFGKDFAYIRDLSNFANVVGRYLKKQIVGLV